MSATGAGQSPAPVPSGDNTVMLTVILRHDQSKNLHEIQSTLGDRGWWERFPPGDAEIVSWVVAMGIGQIVTLRLPADQISLVNVELERSAWGVFHTDFHPTYDFVPVRERLTREWRAAQVPTGGRGLARTLSAPEVPGAPRPGMFSAGKAVGDRFTLSGMHAGDGHGGVLGDGSTYDQARQALTRIRALVEAAGGVMDDVQNLRIHLTDIADKAEVGRARAEFFTGDFPCSTLVEVSRLVEPALTVEIEAEGVLGSATRP
ncbi:RidA family protein [Streptomyces sp. NPDC058045]|uniref:RidA family protein n=1 Tax=Streptomyces sp. NPDC058045 TaxID=3346311 RepID=UPI0036EC92CF